MTSTSISKKFAAVQADSRMAFMPFITAGDPDIEATASLLRTLAGQGVDLIEVGFPYSDPIADGPVIQASYTRALGRGIHVDDIFQCVRSVTSGDDPVACPLLAMVSFGIVFRIGPETFLQKAKDAGFAGLIVPDLPGDEAAEFFEQTRSAGLDLVQLIAPTTPPERVDKILKHCSGFVYCVSIAGTTGERKELPAELQTQLRELRSKTDLPLAVGFGVSRPEHVDALRDVADGFIVGSAIVRQLEGAASTESAIQSIGEFAAEMVQAAKS